MAVSPYEVDERDVRERRIAAVAETTTWEAFARLWPQLLDEVWQAVRSHRTLRPGRNVMLYRDDAPNVLVGVEIDAPFAPIGRVACASLPGGHVAMTTHRGDYGVAAAHAAIVEACDRLGLERLGPRWETYGHWHVPGDEEVEISYLVRPAGVGSGST